MILADAGFDVFLQNMRGTSHSQRHQNLTKTDSAFWKFTYAQILYSSSKIRFSVDEVAKYDAPAAIDKALSLNGASTIYWLGHSQVSLKIFLKSLILSYTYVCRPTQ